MKAVLSITVGKVLQELNEEISEVYLKKNPKEVRAPKISRVTFYRLEKRLNLPKGQRTPGGWRAYSVEEKEEIKKIIKDGYRLN